MYDPPHRSAAPPPAPLRPVRELLLLPGSPTDGLQHSSSQLPAGIKSLLHLLPQQALFVLTLCIFCSRPPNRALDRACPRLCPNTGRHGSFGCCAWLFDRPPRKPCCLAHRFRRGCLGRQRLERPTVQTGIRRCPRNIAILAGVFGHMGCRASGARVRCLTRGMEPQTRSCPCRCVS